MYKRLCFFGILAALAILGSAENHKPVRIAVALGQHVYRVAPADYFFYDLESCCITLPNGTAYELYPNSNVTDPRIRYVVTSSYDKRCAVNITNIGVQDIGTWELQDVNNYTGWGQPEKELSVLPLEIRIEEKVNTQPNGSLTVMEGDDVYIKFLRDVEIPKVCSMELQKKKNSHSTNETSNSIIDLNSDCDLTITNISKSDEGTWSVNATHDIIYYSFTQISVKARPIDNRDIILTAGTEADLIFGPAESIFCQMTDPQGKEMVSQIGQCTVSLPKVTVAHSGLWTAKVGVQGSTNTLDFTYDVIIVENTPGKEPPNTETVVTSVNIEDEHNVKMSCSLIVTAKVHSCRMKRSDGRTFNLEEGIFSGRYSYYGNGLTKDFNNNTIFDCGIQITNPTPEDLTGWECTIAHGDDNIVETGGVMDISNEENKTEVDEENDVANINTISKSIEAAKDNPFEILCSTQSAINYCWFKSPNGTHIVSLYPGSNSSDAFQYIGRGFAFGECGIRVRYAKNSDAGKWSCNMGGSNAVDVKQTIVVKVHEKTLQAQPKSIYLTQYATIGCSMYDNSSVEYCRFVRPDGLGINLAGDFSQTTYEANGIDLKKGKCMLKIGKPSNADLGVWLCAAKSLSKEKEFFDFITVHNNGWYASNYNPNVHIWIFIITVVGIAAIFAILIKYTTMTKMVKRQANRVRNSLRKTPLPESNI